MRFQPNWYKLKSKRKNGKKGVVSGEVQMQFSLVDTYNPTASPEEIYRKYKSVIAAENEEDDLLSRTTTAETETDLDETVADVEHEHDDDTSDETDEPAKAGKSAKREKKKRLARLRRKSIAVRSYEFVGKDSDVSGIIFMEIVRITDLPPETNSRCRVQ